MIHLQMQQEVKSALSSDLDDLKTHLSKQLSSKAAHSDIDSLNHMIQALLMELRHKASKDDLIPYMRKMELMMRGKEETNGKGERETELKS